MNGEAYTAVGTVYDHSKLDSMLKLKSYNENAYLFLLDEEENITYTNQSEDKFFRNYSLLKHLKADKAITEKEAALLQKKMDKKEQGVELLGKDKPFYLGYCPIESNNSMLICIVKKSVVDNVMRNYQKTVLFTTILMGSFIILLFAGLFYSISKLNIADQKAECEKRNSELQLQAMKEMEAANKKLKKAKNVATEALQTAENANKAKTDFLSNMSHDIRTPMNAIIGYAELASRHLQETDKLGRYLEEIQICGKELLSMLGNVLDLARIENNKVEMEYTVSNVHECFENCVIMFQQQAESKNQTISLTEQIMYPYVYMDEPHLSEVCLNIISNAIKYTNTGGWISCNVVQKSCEKEDWCNMIISITDNGIGMSEEFQKRVFETFERERNTTSSHIEGSGIGMGITKKLVELMDGTIEVKSKQGKGSTFTVTIPCRKASEDDSLVKKNSNLRNKNCLNGVRILLVEDNEINTEIATELLTEEGCIVETANDGVACIDMIEKADADYYKMILMDIQMPVMNGYDATLAIRKMKDTKKARIPIIAMTANAFAEDAQKGLSVGMNAHVAKPVDMNILVPTMLKFLGL